MIVTGIPVSIDNLVVGTAKIGENGTVTVNFFGPQGRELANLIADGLADSFTFAPRYIPAIDASQEKADSNVDVSKETV